MTDEDSDKSYRKEGLTNADCKCNEKKDTGIKNSI